MFTIIILIAIVVSLSLAYNKLKKGSTPRFEVTREDWNEYLNRLGHIRRECRQRLDINKDYWYRGAAGRGEMWYVSHGSDYLFQLTDRNDYPEFAIIKKHYNWVRKQLHKA